MQAKPAYIDDTRFILIPSATALLPILDTFLSLTAALPSMTPQISTSLLDVLRTFNSRSCQLILGAGAIRASSTGLRNITTKHLALASQALSFLVALTPYTRECVRRHVPAGQTAVLAEFDKTKRLYQDHQQGIHDKIVDIMTSRSQAHVKALRALDLDATAATAGGGDNNNDDNDDDTVSPYMDTLTRETLTLHRVLARHLGDVDVGMIMRQIAAAYRDHWTAAFAEAEPRTARGEARLLRDAGALAAKLGRIEGFAEIGDEVLAEARSKVAVKGEKGGETGGVVYGKGKEGPKVEGEKKDDGVGKAKK